MCPAKFDCIVEFLASINTFMVNLLLKEDY